MRGHGQGVLAAVLRCCDPPGRVAGWPCLVVEGLMCGREVHVSTSGGGQSLRDACLRGAVLP